MALLDGLKTIITNTVEYMPKFIEAVINIVQQLPGKLQNYWNNIIENVKSFFGNFISKASEGSKNFVDKIGSSCYIYYGRRSTTVDTTRDNATIDNTTRDNVTCDNATTDKEEEIYG